MIRAAASKQITPPHPNLFPRDRGRRSGGFKEPPGESDLRTRTLACLGLLVCVWTFVLMLMGGYVKSIGAGLSCPDWPSCYGQWLPPFPSLETGGVDPATGEAVGYTQHEIMSEWMHRLVAVLLGPILIAFAVLSWRQRALGDVVRYLPAAGLGVLFVQYVIGGLTVLHLSEPVLVVTHLGTATLFLVLMVIPTVLLWAAANGGTAAGATSAAPTAVAAATAPAQGGVRARLAHAGGHLPHRRPDGVWRDPDASEAAAPARGIPGIVRDYVAMSKPRVMFLLVLTSITAMFVAVGGVPALWPTVGIVAGGALATAGAGAVNHFLERDLDTRMERTRDRPVAAGRVQPVHALGFGIVAALLAFVLTTHLANLLAALFVMSGFLFYVFVYTLWLKRTSYWNTVIGGAAGGFPALAGWAAATGGLGLGAWLFFLLIFVWTPAHFFALALVLRDDYAKAGIPMLPVVKGVPRTTVEILAYSILTVLLSFGFFLLDLLGRVYLIAATLLGALLIALALHLHLEPTKRTARTLFGYSILYLGLLYLVAFVDVLAL